MLTSGPASQRRKGAECGRGPSSVLSGPHPRARPCGEQARAEKEKGGGVRLGQATSWAGGKEERAGGGKRGPPGKNEIGVFPSFSKSFSFSSFQS